MHENVVRFFTNACKKRLECPNKFGFLLSGGLDSSLVAAVCTKLVGKPVHTFTIGLENAPDFEPARQVAKAIGSIHHEYTFTVQEGIDVIPQVIRHIETYDVTSVRSSTPQYLLAKKIASLGFKMCFSGEGADECWGGYRYFYYAPGNEDFLEETIQKLYALHQYDCLRTNKSMAAHGVEVRVPFLDQEFINICMNIPTMHKRPQSYRNMEKGILRTAFKGYLPEEILWRRKEQFSDSVGSAWINGLKAYAQGYHPTNLHLCSQTNSPEEAWYLDVFVKAGLEHAYDTVPRGKSIACSTEAATKWVPSTCTLDPSGHSIPLSLPLE